MTRLTNPLKYHGGKYYLANRIISLFKPHIHYVEPYAGGLSVLLAKDPNNVSEVVNDIDGNLTNFWKTLQCPDRFEDFHRRCNFTPFSMVEWCGARKYLEDRANDINQKLKYIGSPVCEVEHAIKFFIYCRMSLAGRMRSFTGITKTRTRSGMNNEVSAWLNCVEGLPEVHARLKRVLILNKPVIDVIQSQDDTGTLMYLDPPYLPSTRISPDVYKHEMSVEDHKEMLEAIVDCKSKIVLSGYDNSLYDEYLISWKKYTYNIPNHSSQSKHKKRVVETVWLNYSP